MDQDGWRDSWGELINTFYYYYCFYYYNNYFYNNYYYAATTSTTSVTIIFISIIVGSRFNEFYSRYAEV